MELQPETTTSSPAQPHQPKTYELTAAGISYTKSTSSLLFKPTTTPPTSSRRHILRDVTFTARPSEILAIVGPSGAGKSTLIDILAARTAPSGGSLLVNAAPLSPSSFRKLSAHLPQHDAGLLLPLLTVAETFSFAARLLLPSSAAGDVISAILSDLRLSHLSHVLLGSSSRRGLSGGELRRVSIGLGLLHDPAVLLLDEPTSGLDSRSAFDVVHVLRSLCLTRRRTVVLSIHQPSFKILSRIDKILLLHGGVVFHHGTLDSLQSFMLRKGFTVPPQLNALEYAMEVLNQVRENDGEETTTPPHVVLLEPAPGNDDDHVAVLYRSSRLHEVMVLYSRLWRVIYRTRQLLVTNTLEALIVGLVLGTIYIDIGYGKEGIEKRFGLFAFTLTFLLSSTTEALPIFINERPVILREASGGVYRLSSYLVANTLVFVPYLLAIAVVYSVSLYFLVGLCATWQAFAYFVLVIWVVVLMANSFVLFVSSLAPNFITGTSLVTVLLGAFFLFSGYFISREGLPKYWLFMHFMSMYKYALDALLINEYACLVTTCLIWYEEDDKECMVTGKDVMEKRGLHEAQRWTNIYVLIAFFVLYRLLCFLVLVRRVSRSKK